LIDQDRQQLVLAERIRGDLTECSDQITITTLVWAMASSIWVSNASPSLIAFRFNQTDSPALQSVSASALAASESCRE
jgi:hypothetical protein